MELNERADKLLRTLIRLHVGDGNPVGSRTLAREAGLDLSAATIRNVMSDLEEMGLIASPHTSAGRVPTQQGYRIFVDRMMTIKPLDERIVEKLQVQLCGEDDTQTLVSRASQAISQLTQFAGVVMLPKEQTGTFKRIEFLNLRNDRVLAILVTQEGKVQNRVIRIDRPFSESELIEATNFFNERYAGRPMEAVRRALLGDMKRDSDEINRIMHTLSVVGGKVFEDDPEHSDMVVSGEERLLDVPDLAELETLRRLFDTFKTKHDLVELLDKSIKADGVSVFIGNESGYSALNDVSVVVSPYESEGRVLGVVGVIGPTRMAYDEVVPMVDVTARLLGNALAGPVE